VTARDHTEAAVARWFARAGQGRGKAEVGLWMGGAFSTALVLAIVAIAMTPRAGDHVAAALRATARLSFLFFWPAYAGSAIALLFGRRFALLARYGREFGLAYASAQLVHVLLVSWLVVHSTQPFIEATMPFFSIGFLWTYFLAFSSFERLQHLFNPNLLRVLRNLGLEYIALVFFADFVIGPIESGIKHPIEYIPFSFLLICGFFLRLAATMRRMGGHITPMP
jgi:hypothetical protein